MRISSSLQGVSDLLIPEDVYKSTISHIDATDPNDPEKPLLSKAGNPMIVVKHKILEGPFAGKELGYDRVMVGGVQKDGSEMNVFRLMDLITAYRLPWGCENCHSAEVPRDFIKGTRENGLALGKYHCPDCRKIAALTYETNAWIGAGPAKIAVSIEKVEGSDRERNVIDRYERI